MTHATYSLHGTESDHHGKPLRIAVTGELDATNIEEFATEIKDALGDRPVVVDLSAVDFIDSAGYAALHLLADTGHVAIMMRPDSILCRAATIMGLPYHHDLDSAEHRLERPL